MDEEKILADTKSYRALISDFFGVPQVNFAQGASSNDRQFRLASEYFIGPKRKHSFAKELKYKKYEVIRDPSWPTTAVFKKEQQLPDWIIGELGAHVQNDEFEEFRQREEYVLWFITSTARKEFYNATQRIFENEMLSNPESAIIKNYIADYYDHTYELERLAQQMELWNAYFRSKNIKNLWIDTFNHHDYPFVIDNLITFESGFNDLMSNMCVSNGFMPSESSIHLSNWMADDLRSKYLMEQGLLTQQTLHPTIAGHQLIANMLVPKIQQHFNL
jgi:lysophospholipase L1-like esterase